MKKSQLVMVGNGMAGVRTLEELLKLAPDLYDITCLAQSRPELTASCSSTVLAGEQTLDEIVLKTGLVACDTHHAARRVTVTEVEPGSAGARVTARAKCGARRPAIWPRVNPSMLPSRARSWRACWPTATLPTRRP